jgi:uncharacterized protein (DUF1501 family)
VKGGKVYGRWPGLAPEAAPRWSRPAITTDFRAVFNEVVAAILGLTDTSRVFPGFKATKALGLFA